MTKTPHPMTPHVLAFPELLALIAMMMATAALSLDMVLPALGLIGDAYAVPNPNDRQEVITAFLAGIGIGQLFYGPLSDRFGRKTVLMSGLALFIAGAIWAAVTASFSVLLLARFVQGFGAASPRVISTAVVRDLFSGDRMARVMSFAMIIFIIVPIFAPALGMLVLNVSTWPAIFLTMAAFAGLLALWSGLRLPETHPAERTEHLPFFRQLQRNVMEVLRSPVTVGYAVATGFLFAVLMTYVSTAQQVFQDIYHLGNDFPLAFGSIAAVIAVANLLNARFVMRFGATRIGLVSSFALLVACGVLLVIALFGNPPFAVYWLMMAIILFLFAATVPNLNSLAMVPMGRVAGTASSFMGFYTTAVAALLSWFIGGHLGQSVLPIAAGFFCCALAAVVAAQITARRFAARAVSRHPGN